MYLTSLYRIHGLSKPPSLFHRILNLPAVISISTHPEIRLFIKKYLSPTRQNTKSENKQLYYLLPEIPLFRTKNYIQTHISSVTKDEETSKTTSNTAIEGSPTSMSLTYLFSISNNPSRWKKPSSPVMLFFKQS